MSLPGWQTLLRPRLPLLPNAGIVADADEMTVGEKLADAQRENEAKAARQSSDFCLKDIMSECILSHICAAMTE